MDVKLRFRPNNKWRCHRGTVDIANFSVNFGVLICKASCGSQIASRIPLVLLTSSFKSRPFPGRGFYSFVSIGELNLLCCCTTPSIRTLPQTFFCSFVCRLCSPFDRKWALRKISQALLFTAFPVIPTSVFHSFDVNGIAGFRFERTVENVSNLINLEMGKSISNLVVLWREPLRWNFDVIERIPNEQIWSLSHWLPLCCRTLQAQHALSEIVSFLQMRKHCICLFPINQFSHNVVWEDV